MGRIFLAILAALVGAIISYFLVGFAAFTILEAAGSSNINGGLAMGVFTSIAPLGAIIGGILCAVLVLRAGRTRQTAKPAQTEHAGQPEAGPELHNEPRDTAPASSTMGRDILITFGVIAAIAFGLYSYFLAPPAMPRSFAEARAPIVEFEIRAPSSAIAEDQYFTMALNYRTWEHMFYLGKAPDRTVDGNHIVIRDSARMRYHTDRRSILFSPNVTTQITFKLNYSSNPTADTAFTDWRPADEMSRGESSPVSYTADSFQIRTRLKRAK